MRAELMVRVVGTLAVYLAGRPLSATEVGTRKARTLLALLAVQRTHLPIDRIIYALWGDAQPRDPVRNTATLVSRLRAVLGSSAIDGDIGGYRLGSHVRVDLFEAADLVLDAELRMAGQPVAAFATVRKALRLLGESGVLAEQADVEWAEPARSMHGVLLCHARHIAAELALRVGDLRLAQAAAEAAVAADPFDEPATRLLMRVHVAAGAPAWALIVYGRLRTTLATELGVDPAAATSDLHVTILRGTPRALRAIGEAVS